MKLRLVKSAHVVGGIRTAKQELQKARPARNVFTVGGIRTVERTVQQKLQNAESAGK
jgi:hypothetical protein